MSVEELLGFLAGGGLFLGALVWLGLALLRDWRDDRLTSPDDKPLACICDERNPRCICLGRKSGGGAL